MLKILYYDDFIAVALKPAGLLSEGEGKDCFPSLLSTQLSSLMNKSVKLYTVHRLDRSTEGIMVYALTSEAAALLSADVGNGKWQKIYYALLWGIPTQKSDRLCDLLYYDRSKGKSFVVARKRKGIKQAILSYRVVQEKDNRALVQIALETGRTHQIRAQFSSRGLPLCGDRRYGAPAESGKNLALCAYRLCFDHPFTKKRLEFEIEPSNIQAT